MKLLLNILIGFVGGFAIGVALSSVIGVTGMLLLDKAIGIPYLSIYTAVIGAIIVPIFTLKNRLSI